MSENGRSPILQACEIVDTEKINSATNLRELSYLESTLKVQAGFLAAFEILLICSSLAVGASSDYLAGWIVMVLIIPGSLLSHFRLLLLASRRRLTLSASFRL